jgi:hypothetical protein
MFFLLFLYHLLSHSAEALPIAGMSSTVSSALQARASEEYFCNNLKHCRTIWNIIWSSLATILSWTWLALHPNIPYPAETHNMTFRQTRLHEMRVFFRQRLPLFLLTLILPEYILAWAIRQRFVAREIAKETGMLSCGDPSSRSLHTILRLDYDTWVFHHHGRLPFIRAK